MDPKFHSTHVQYSPKGMYACPYCDGDFFDRDDALWDHVRQSHATQIQGAGVKGGTALFRKLLKEEGLHQAKQIPSGKRSHIHDLTAPVSRHRSSGCQDGKPRRALADEPHIVDDEDMADEFIGRVSYQQTTVMGQEPCAASYSALPHHVPPQDQRPKTHRDHALTPTSTLSSASPAPAPISSRSSVLPMPTNEQWPDLVLQPDSRPISQEQLAAEVKSIYAGLTMVESKCIHVDKAQAAAEQDPVSGQQHRMAPDLWQARIALHRTLLYEHHDFFLASQHPSASPALRHLAGKYSMPARMWKHGIHSFLELLRHHLPGSLEYMLTFIYLAYQMVALLCETVPAFEDTWIECLGDLGRYRMAIEDEDLRDRDTWAGVARFWYSKAADKSPSVGRLYHHLAILARPSALQQLYFYCRSLTCVQPFMSARESILTLFDPILGRCNTSYSNSLPVETSFIRTHGLLFEKDDGFQHAFDLSLTEFTRQLDNSIGRVTSKWKEQGAYMAIANIASLFDYGSEDNFLRIAFATQHPIEKNGDPDGRYHSTLPQQAPANPTLNLQAVASLSFACRLVFDTLGVVLQRFGDKNVLTHFHILLAFLLQLTTLPYDTSYIFKYVQWEEFAFFLNTLAKLGSITPVIESPSFLHEGEEDFRPLPEDYLIRGQLWAYSYYPSTWFGYVVDEEERTLELASTIRSRTERILWLGIRLASRNLGLKYDSSSRTWSARNAGDEAMDVGK